MSECDGAYYPSPEAWKDGSNTGYLSYEPTDATSASAVINELDLLLTAGRLDAQSKAVITAEYSHALSRSACPVDRSREMCGRLTPGQALRAGEFITNALGEELCFTFDGVARHIGVDGREVFSTAVDTRNLGETLQFEEWCGDRLGRQTVGNTMTACLRLMSSSKAAWRSNTMQAGSRTPFASFLQGPCDQFNTFGFTAWAIFDYRKEFVFSDVVQCEAEDTCRSGHTENGRTDAYRAQRARTDATYAVRVAQNLITSTAAFATTNEPSPSVDLVPVSPLRISSGKPYKALVVFFMRGGADTFNLLVPHSECDAKDLRKQYERVRGAVGLAHVDPIDVPAGSQPCDKFGIHPDLPTLTKLYNDGDAAFVANAGSLIEPLTKEQYFTKQSTTPPQLFAHNTMQNGAENLHPQKSFADGIVGRIFKALDQQGEMGAPPLITNAYTITNNKYIFRGSPVEPIVLDPNVGMVTYEGAGAEARAGNLIGKNRTLRAIEEMTSTQMGSMYAETHNAIVRAALSNSDRIHGILEGVSLHADWSKAHANAPIENGANVLVPQLEQVARVIAARQELKAERDVFLVELGNFDTHVGLLDGLAYNFLGMDKAFEAFETEMKALNVWHQVTLLGISEFARTMTTNGKGTDHAWGGNYFLFGGDVSGGKIHGEFPELRPDGPNAISSTGQMLPTSPWEAIWKPIATWLGVQDVQMGAVMPNMHNFPGSLLLNASDVFDMAESWGR